MPGLRPGIAAHEVAALDAQSALVASIAATAPGCRASTPASAATTCGFVNRRRHRTGARFGRTTPSEPLARGDADLARAPATDRFQPPAAARPRLTSRIAPSVPRPSGTRPSCRRSSRAFALASAVSRPGVGFLCRPSAVHHEVDFGESSNDVAVVAQEMSTYWGFQVGAGSTMAHVGRCWCCCASAVQQ